MDEFIEQSYGPYAYYTFQHRALIGDDGLKPVNKRILYSMFTSGITPSHQHQKAAKLAGHCTTWHPHGNAAIEEALARMGQKFSMRVPLIDPHGSVGFVTGDRPAHARYWEARLTPAAMELLSELKDGAVEMGKNYDSTEDEPPYLPVRFPNNLINGSEGVAVGYTAKIPSHNPDETMDAVLLALKNPDFTADDLLKVMPGPDFPTGGEIVNIDGIRDYYESGTGSFTVRGRYHVETLSRGKVKIIFYELPFQVSIEKTINSIQQGQQNGKFAEIANVKDLTDRKNGLRMSIETKAGTNYKKVINDIFSSTPAESSFSVINNVLVDKTPTIVSTVDLIKRFVDFRRECVVRKARNRIGKIESRMHQLQGLLAALIDIDKAISIIRNAESPDDARRELMEGFTIDEGQADYILSMQLRRLTKADSVALEKENEELQQEREKLDAMLADEVLIDKQVAHEIRQTKKVISDERRTVISRFTSEDMKEKEKAQKEAAKNADKNLECFITRFANGKLLKTLDRYSYQLKSAKFENGPIIEQMQMKTQDEMIVIGSDGIGRRIPLSYLIEKLPSGDTDYGVTFPAGVVPVGIAKASTSKKEQGVMMMTNKGNVKTSKTDFPPREEFPVFNKLDSDEYIVNAQWVPEPDGYAVSIASDSNLLCFHANDVRVSGSAAGGVRGQKLASGAEVISFEWLPKDALKAEGLEDAYKVVTQADETAKMTLLLEYGVKGRGGQGMRSHPFRKKESALRRAYVGKNVVSTLRGNARGISLPPLSKRNTIGVELTFDIELGEALMMEDTPEKKT